MCSSRSFLHSTTAMFFSIFFFFNDTATTEIYTLSLHDALPISTASSKGEAASTSARRISSSPRTTFSSFRPGRLTASRRRDRKSTRLNSSHSQISYAVFCLKKKKKKQNRYTTDVQL